MFEQVHTEEFDGFTIILSLEPEFMEPDWDFESEEVHQDTLDKIDQGDLLYFVAKVTATREDVILGVDYLGGCCYESIKDFLSDGYYRDMRDTAIQEARDKIAKLTAIP